MTKQSQREKALMCRLPFYIEHKLLQQMFGKEPVWQMIPTDFTWQALCRYYALVLKQHPLRGCVADAKALRKWLATGNRLTHFQYPLRWDYEGIDSFNDPNSVANELERFSDGFAETSTAPAFDQVLSLTGFTRHMKRKPRGLLKISRITRLEKWPVLILDDGLVQSGYYDDQDDYTIPGEDIFADSRTPTLIHHRILDTRAVRLQIWRRWQSVWRWAQPPDILTEDEKQFDGVEYIAALVAQFLQELDEALEILTAVPAWRQGGDQVVAALVEVIKRNEEYDPVGTQNKLDRLLEPAKALLLPHGIWAG